MAKAREEARRKTTRESIDDHAPWKPAKWDISIAGAIQGLARGDCDPHQQRNALKWIVEELCGYYDISYRPGQSGERDTAFAEGKRFVGAQIVKMTKVNIAKLR